LLFTVTLATHGGLSVERERGGEGGTAGGYSRACQTLYQTLYQTIYPRSVRDSVSELTLWTVIALAVKVHIPTVCNALET